MNGRKARAIRKTWNVKHVRQAPWSRAEMRPMSRAVLERIAARKATLDALRAFAGRMGVSATWLATGRDVIEVEIPRAEAERLVAIDVESSGFQAAPTLIAALMEQLGEETVRGLA